MKFMSHSLNLLAVFVIAAISFIAIFVSIIKANQKIHRKKKNQALNPENQNTSSNSSVDIKHQNASLSGINWSEPTHTLNVISNSSSEISNPSSETSNPSSEPLNEFEVEIEQKSELSQKLKKVAEQNAEFKKPKVDTPIVKLKTIEDLNKFDKIKLFEVQSCGKKYMLTEKQLFFYDKIKSSQTLHQPASGKEVATAFTVEKYKHLSVSEFKKLPKWKFKISPHMKTVRGLIKCGLITREGVDGFRAY